MRKLKENQTPAKPTTFPQVLAHLMNKQKDGVITLDKFVKKCPKELRGDALEFLRTKARGGDFIEGRRGHPSRFVFGEAQEKWRHSEEVRREWRIRNGRNPDTGGPLNPQRRGRKPSVEGNGKNGLKNGGTHKVALHLEVGGQKHVLPLSMALVPARQPKS